MSLWLQALDDNALLTQAAIPAAAPTRSGRLLNCRILKGSAAEQPYPVAPAGNGLMSLLPVAFNYRTLLERDL